MLQRVVMHNEVSLDGRTRGFTSNMGLYYELAGRWDVGATLTGADTILAAIPPEQVQEEDASAFEPPLRDPDDQRQLLAITDSWGRVRCWHQLRQVPYWRDVVALCSHSTPESYLAYLRERHIDTVVTGQGQVDLRTAFEELNARYDVELVRLDSGGALNNVLLHAGLVDEVSLLVNPSLVGDTAPLSIFRTTDLAPSPEVIQLKLLYVSQLELDHLWLRYDVVK